MPALLGVAQHDELGRWWQGHRLAPTGQRIQNKTGTEREPGRRTVRNDQADDLSAALAREIAYRKLVEPACQILCRDGHDVPVQRPLSSDRHPDHQLADVGVEGTTWPREGTPAKFPQTRGRRLPARRSLRRRHAVKAPADLRRRCAWSPTSMKSRDRRPRVPRATRPCIAASSSSLHLRSVAASPITARLSAEWPTMKAVLIASPPSSRSRYSAVVRQSHGTPCSSASRGMPSTRASIRMRYSPESPDSGATVNPQLPPRTVVTPCSGDGDSVGSQKPWTSR